MQAETLPPTRRHTWPWWVLGALALGAVAAFLWINAEVRRTQARRQYYISTPETNAVAPER